MPDIAMQYIRRSTDHQEDSLEQQRAINDQYIHRKGYLAPASEHHAVWVETGSGRSFDDRPVFQAMLKAVESGEVGATKLIIYRPSRFGRAEDLTEFGYYEHRFRRAGVEIEFASGEEYNLGGIAGHLTRSLAYAQAAEYSKDLSNYSTRGMLENARNGYSTGGKPCLGYVRMLVDREGNRLGELKEGMVKGDDRNLKVMYVLDQPHVVEFVRTHIFQRPFELGWGPAKTVRELNKLLQAGKGLPPSRAGRTIHRKDGKEVRYPGYWKPATIYDMWTRTTYIGWRTFNVEAKNEFHGMKIVNKSSHEPLIDEPVFWALFERTKGRPWNERKMAPARRRKPGRYPLSGLGVCAHCGQGISGSNSTNSRTGLTQYYYKDCGETHAICQAPRWSIPVKDFEDWVRERTGERLKSPHFQQSLLSILRARLAPDQSQPQRERDRQQLEEVTRAIDSLLDLAINMPKQSAALAGRLSDLETQKTELERRLVEAGQVRRPVVEDALLQEMAAKITEQSLKLLEGDGEMLAELAPRFIKEFRVDKEKRRIEVEFFDIPGFRPEWPKSLSRTEVVEET